MKYLGEFSVKMIEEFPEKLPPIYQAGGTPRGIIGKISTGTHKKAPLGRKSYRNFQRNSGETSRKLPSETPARNPMETPGRIRSGAPT